jgi:hypothetical protein
MPIMNPENFESRLTSMGMDVVLRTDGRILRLFIGAGGRGLTAYLPPLMVEELEAMLANWKNLYYGGAFYEDAKEA